MHAPRLSSKAKPRPAPLIDSPINSGLCYFLDVSMQ